MSMYERFISINTKFWDKDNNLSNKNIILVEGRIFPNQIIPMSIISNIVKNKKKYTQLVIFSNQKIYNDNSKIYRSFGISHFYLFSNEFYKNKKILLKILLKFFIFISQFIYNKFSFDWFVEKYHIDNIYFGDVLYDTYIRKDLIFLNLHRNMLKFFKIVFKSISKYYLTKQIFDENNVKCVIVSTNFYDNNGTFLERIALYRNINVILSRGGEYPKVYSNYSDILMSIDKIDQNKVENLDFDDKKLNIIEKYLSDRFIGKAKNINFDITNAYQNKQKFDKNYLEKYYGFNFQKENNVVFIFLHGFSDASHVSGRLSFTSYYDWFIQTIDFIKDLKHINWVVKPHPSSNIYGEEGIVENILKQTKATNIYLAPPNISNLSVFNISNVVVTAAGTIGIEASCMGLRAILVGDAGYSGFGFTIDCKNKEEYFKNLSNINKIKPLSDKEILLAKKVMYIYHLDQDLHSNILIEDGHLTPGEDLSNDEKIDEIYNKISDNLLKYDYKDDSFYKYIEDNIIPKLS